MVKKKIKKKILTWEEALGKAIDDIYPVLVKLREYDLKHERVKQDFNST